MVKFITGGAGFIGANYLYHLLAQPNDDTLVCIDALTYAGSLATLEQARSHRRFHFHKADIRNQQEMALLFERYRPDMVINFAAQSHVDRSIDDPAPFFSTNVNGVVVLLELCRRYRNTHFHQISTDEVYGSLPYESSAVFTEDSPLRPTSPYAASKAAADLVALSYYQTYGLNISISRSANNYGPYQFPEKLIPLCLLRAGQDKPIPLYGDGRNRRQWLYVEDHCRALDLITEQGAPGRIYPVAPPTETDNLTLVRTLLRLLGKSESLITFTADRAAHDTRYFCAAQAIAALGWQAQIPLIEGLKRTIAWYEAHNDWLKQVIDGSYLSYYRRHYRQDF